MKLDVREWIAFALILVAVGGEGFLFLFRPGRGGEEEVRATLDLAEAMGGVDTAGYARATEPRPFVFPADHGPHPAFRTEWWYVTANLQDDAGRRFGTQFTLFRNALAPEVEVGRGEGGGPEAGTGDAVGDASAARDAGDGVGAGGDATDARASAWATRQVYMGHFAVTDVEGEGFHEAERFTRAANGLAGGEVEPLRIWMDDWSLMGGGGAAPEDPGAGPVFPLHVRAREGGVAVDLALVPAKPHVLQGDRGLSQKGPEAGNASFYYSFTRLRAEGTVEVDGRVYRVTGLAWLDREWSTSALSEGQEGWDWFALQLSDGRDLMVYRLRGPGGSTDPLSEGVVVAPDGSSRRLVHDDFRVTSTDTWTSSLDGTAYPSGWEVEVPGEGLRLRIAPVLRDQELNVAVRYWEGAVDVTSLDGSDDLTGHGYVELTGYGAPVSGRVPGTD